MKWSVEWLSEVHRSGLAKGVAERAAGDLCAVERAVGHLIVDEGAAGHLDVVELDAGDLSAVLREVERAVGHLSADKSAAVHLDVVERAVGDFRADETYCMPPGGCDVRDDLLVDECGRRTCCWRYSCSNTPWPP